MGILKIEILNQDAMAILRGMEKIGLITLPPKKSGNKKLSEQLRGSISASRAQEMMDSIEKERATWEQRF